MAKPKQEPRSPSYLEDVDLFFDACQRLGRDPLSWRRFLQDILTDSELRMIKRRFHIARLLAEGKGVREVARLAQVGTDTVNRVAKALRSGSGAFKRAVGQARKTRIKPADSETPTRHWIFGDTSD